jgi:hypothetical protein
MHILLIMQFEIITLFKQNINFSYHWQNYNIFMKNLKNAHIVESRLWISLPELIMTLLLFCVTIIWLTVLED